MSDWRDEWLEASDPYMAYEILEKHWLSIHPEDAITAVDDELDCLALVDKYVADPEIIASQKETKLWILTPTNKEFLKGIQSENKLKLHTCTIICDGRKNHKAQCLKAKIAF